MSSKSWMWSSLSLALLVGVGLGVIADRVLFSDRVAYADAGNAPQKAAPLWFICEQRGSLDIEAEPGYGYTEKFRTALLEGLSKELGLSPDQHTEVDAFLEERRHGAHEFWENSRHTYCDMRDGFRADLRTMLDSDQQVRFDKLMAQIDAHQAEYVGKLKATQQSKETVTE